MPAKPPTIGACPASSCRAAIRYIHLVAVAGEAMPLDMDLERGGLFVPVVHQGVKCVRLRTARDSRDRPGFTAHWVRCPQPAIWAARRQKLDRAGVTSAGHRRAVGVQRGPCAGCRRPDHVVYGPHCTGLLCADCLRLRAAWLSGGACTPLLFPRWPG